MQTIQIKDKFHRVADKYKGQILIHNGSGRSLAFTPIEKEDSHVMCDCGHPFWNATNFGNKIHFCPNKEYTFEVTEFRAQK